MIYYISIMTTVSQTPKRNYSGLTLVELLVVIAVISILVTVGTIGFRIYQQDVRNAERASKVTLIAEELERYYDQNGEYPGCEAVTADATIAREYVFTMTEPDILLAPRADSDTTNSISCAEFTNESDDFFSYVGDPSDTCQTGVACTKWTLSYREERSGEIISLQSRREVSELTAAAPSLTAEAAGLTQINVSWTETQNATSYQLQRSETSGFSSPTITVHSGTSQSVTGLTPDTTYHFRVRAVFATGTGGWSNVSSATTGDIVPPSGITISAAMLGANAQGASAGGTCTPGSTLERQIRYNTNGGAWSGWTNGNTRSVAATEGYRYTFQAQARCTVSGVSTNWATSSTAAVTRPVTAPSGLTVSATMSGTNAVGTAGGGSCASGATIERQLRYNSSPTSAQGSWSGWTNGSSRSVAALQGHRYIFQQQARCVGLNANSGWVASGSANTVRTIAAPATPTLSVSTSGNTSTFTRNNVSCPTGTTARYGYKYIADWGYNTEWYGPTTGVQTLSWNTANQGYQYQVQMRAQCYTVHSTSAWSGTRTASYTRPVAQPTGVSWNIRRGTGRRQILITPTATCHSSVHLYGSMVEWSGDAPHYWVGGPNNGKLGWYQDSGYRVTNVYNPNGGMNTATDVVNGKRFRGRAELRCRNSVTNRQSSAITNTSAIWSAI